MILRFSLLLPLLVASLAKEQDALPSCPRNSQDLHQKYHTHDKCNHEWQTSDQLWYQRADRHQYLGRTGLYPHIAPQKTVVCPLEPVDLTPPNGVIGLDTRWIVENKASTPVVLIYLDNGEEKSAMNANIMPPQADPHAILQPNHHTVVNTHEGHTFYVRELLPDGSTMGDILLQHRPGIVEFTNRFGQQLDCGGDETHERNKVHDDTKRSAAAATRASTSSSTNPNTESCTDMENDVTTPNTQNANNAQEPTSSDDASPALPKNHHHHCNIIYQGFRNTLNCPLDIYFAGTQSVSPNGSMQCKEEKKFHLGTQALNTTSDQDAQLSFQVSYMGHSFVARLASNPNVVVDRFTFAPTEIHDCPRRKQQQQAVVQQEQVIEFNGIQNANGNMQNNTFSAVALSCPNDIRMDGMSS